MKIELYDTVEHKNGGFFEVIEEPSPTSKSYIVEDSGELFGKLRVSDESFDVIRREDVVRVLSREEVKRMLVPR